MLLKNSLTEEMLDNKMAQQGREEKEHDRRNVECLHILERD
jgi:hypothetical protein